jgi:hypothetical protein
MMWNRLCPLEIIHRETSGSLESRKGWMSRQKTWAKKTCEHVSKVQTQFQNHFIHFRIRWFCFANTHVVRQAAEGGPCFLIHRHMATAEFANNKFPKKSSEDIGFRIRLWGFVSECRCSVSKDKFPKIISSHGFPNTMLADSRGKCFHQVCLPQI